MVECRSWWTLDDSRGYDTRLDPKPWALGHYTTYIELDVEAMADD